VTERQILVASNRGPVSFVRDGGGGLVPRRGGGGLVTALSGVLQRSGGLWLASAMSRHDREAAERGRVTLGLDDARYDVRYLAFPRETYDRYYNGISNRVLWFLHHYLWDLPRSPSFDRRTRREWDSYRDVNRTFAEALDEEGRRSGPDPTFLVQDYHMSLVPAMLRERRPDARIGHFSHIPFAGPSYLKILPADVRHEMLEGLLAADVVGFHAEAWADNFLECCRVLLGAPIATRARTIRWNGRTVRVGVYPIPVDTETMLAAAADPAVPRAAGRLGRWLGDARLILRVDRTELSKNILRGFRAYEQFLRRHPRWRGRVVHLALLNSSRGSIREYRDYLRECLRTAGSINATLGGGRWQPIRVVVGDHYPTVLAAYGLYDVLLVNPVFDGMNLVAKEGPLLNRRDGVLVLSENAGAFAELGPDAVGINPFDVEATAEALARALEMDPGERARRAKRLRDAVMASVVERWVQGQLEDLDAAEADRATPARGRGGPPARRAG
jgi:trehalose 6-phosphate synthase